MKNLRTLALCGLVLMTAACTHKEEKVIVQQPAAPAVGSLTRTLDMVDADGRHYGTVTLDPAGGGKVTDMDGRTIGYISNDRDRY